MNYSAEERESNLNATDADKTWVVYTLQQAVIGKMNRAGIEPVKVDADGAHHYRLNFNQVSFRSGKKRVMSEEQKQAASERFKEYHKNKI